MTLDEKRWAQLASELRFSQLDIARKQAEVWRAGLAALTALLTAILVLKGRDNVSDLTEPCQALVAGLLVLALVLLIAATMWVSRALAGPAGRTVRLSGKSVRRWTEREVDKISLALQWVPWLAAAGVLVVAGAVGVTWLAPVQATTTPLVQVAGSTGQECGQFLGETATQLIVRPSVGSIAMIPLAEVISVTPVTTCPG
jgi:hypothetical protein